MRITGMIFATFAILIGFTMPRPSLRVEKISGSPSANELTIISSSILHHTSDCSPVSLSRKLSEKEISNLGAAGLNPEETSFIISKYGIEKPMLVFGLYYLLSTQNYSFTKHLYYNRKRGGALFERTPWTKDDSYILNTATGLSYREKLIDQVGQLENRCDANKYIVSDVDELHFKDTYYNVHNWNKYIDGNLELLGASLNHIYIIFPNDDFIPEKMRKSLFEIEMYLASKGVKVFHPKLEDLDEPWCLCGHLSDSGQDRLLEFMDL